MEDFLINKSILGYSFYKDLGINKRIEIKEKLFKRLSDLKSEKFFVELDKTKLESINDINLIKTEVLKDNYISKHFYRYENIWIENNNCENENVCNIDIDNEEKDMTLLNNKYCCKTPLFLKAIKDIKKDKKWKIDH